MTAGDDKRDDNALAGEYVLGVLPAGERRAVERRMGAEPEFADLVAAWQADLSTLDDAYAPEPPPVGLKARIEARLFAEADQRSTGQRGGIWNSLVVWRGLALAGVATTIVLGLVNTGLIGERPGETTPALMAELGAPGSSVGLIASLDASNGQLQIVPAAFSPDDGKSLELWLVPGEGAPVSLGLVPEDGGQLALPPEQAEMLTAGAVIAVSLEPGGGSPTGAPTGPVVLSGALR